MLISVCLCTYKRPSVAQTLESLAEQMLPAGTAMEIVVVENDASGAARPLVAAFADASAIPVSYAIESERNISAARNRCLVLARGEWLAFIDDDEVADPDWLARLLETATAHQADVVLGRVIATYPAEAPDWLVAADPLSRDWGPTGSACDSGSTANALVRRASVRRQELLFDLRFGRTGGEDSDFFSRLRAGGSRIVCCREAVVREEVPTGRLAPGYLRRRALRAGQTTGELFLRAPARSGRIRLLLWSGVKTLGFYVLAASMRRFRRAAAWRMQVKAWLNLGKLRACIGLPTPTMY